jgi:hypothetical protein
MFFLCSRVQTSNIQRTLVLLPCGNPVKWQSLSRFPSLLPQPVRRHRTAAPRSANCAACCGRPSRLAADLCLLVLPPLILICRKVVSTAAFMKLCLPRRAPSLPPSVSWWQYWRVSSLCARSSSSFPLRDANPAAIPVVFLGTDSTASDLIPRVSFWSRRRTAKKPYGPWRKPCTRRRRQPSWG